MKKIILLPIICAMALFTHAQVNFQSLKWSDAKEQAMAQNKYLFVDCYTEWCGPCRKMAKETFMDSTVGAFMNDRFVNLKMDVEKAEGPKFSLKYRVYSYPTYLIFDSEGKLVYTSGRFQEAGDFLNTLNQSLDPSKQTNYKGISYQFDLAFPDFISQHLEDRSYRPDSATLFSYLDQQENLLSEVNWAILSRYGTDYPRYREFMLDHKDELVELYGKNEVGRVINTKEFERIDRSKSFKAHYDNAVNNKNEKELEIALQLLDEDPNPQTPIVKIVYRIEFYTSTEQFTKLMDLFDELAASPFGYQLHPLFNNGCWGIYEKCDDPALVKRAVNHMAKAAYIEEDSYAELDTYAALLYKDKQYDLAESTAREAIEAGEKTNEDVASTKELLDKIQKTKMVITSSPK
ncbi:MAG TPA: thioredoxin family protein [Chitinophagales bacterium]|nr:thioredoxin family protein [Chitinophagales bacterium]